MRTIPIHPLGLAAMNIENAGKPYRPSNGTEGDYFMDGWCRKCARDASMSEGLPIEECDDDQLCKIIADTFAYDQDDPRYPTAWQFGADGQPRCTSFVEIGQPIPHKDEHTVDMFAHPAATGSA